MTSSPQRHRSLLLGGLLLVLAGVSIAVLRLGPGAGLDVDAFWEAGLRMRAGGGDLYPLSSDPHLKLMPFLYPPSAAALFAPFTWLPRPVAYALWGGLQWAFLAAAFFGLRRLCRVEDRGRDFALLLLGGVFAATFMNFASGQVNVLLVACMAWALVLIDEDRPIAGGGLLAVGAHLKVLPIVLVGVLVAQRRWRALGGFALGATLLLAAPVPWAGVGGAVDLQSQWVDEVLLPGIESGRPPQRRPVQAPNNSLPAVAGRWFADDERLSGASRTRSPLLFVLPGRLPARLGVGVAAALYLLALLLAHRLRPSHDGAPNERHGDHLVGAAGLALMAAALANPLCWTHHLCLAALFLAPLVANAFERPEQHRAVAITLALFVGLTLLPILPGPAIFDALAVWGAPTAGVLVAWAVTWRTLWSRPEPR